ncbi:MAG: AAA family ATPase [Myxococcota bacterium]
MRRLLLATVHVERVQMRSGAGVRLEGYDGVVEARRASPFCPAGLSVWELSTEAKPEKKATKDLAKREKSSPPPIVPSQTVYVVVTAHRFSHKQHWAHAQRERGAWRGIEVLDADDLSMWLGQCPAVAQWFAHEHLRRPAAGWCDARSWMHRWERRSQPPLPADLVLIDRDQERTQLLQWLERSEEGTGASLRIRAEHREQACLFVAATVTAASQRDETTPDPDRVTRLEARTLMVETQKTWSLAAQLDTSVPLVLVPTFAGFDPAEHSVRHATIIPVDPDEGAPTFDELRIDEPLPWRALVTRLQAHGKPESDAKRLAQDSGGHLNALQRMMGSAATPPWTNRAPRQGLVAMLLMGAWQPEHPGDAAIATRLGTAPDELDGMCTDLASVSDAPITREGHGWRWSSHGDAWQLLGGRLSSTDLDRFRTIALEVLGQDDPRYELPKGERWAATVQGKVLPYSNALREGIAQSLVRLSLADAQLAAVYRRSKGRARADGVLRELLAPRWVRWASLSPVLHTLAEAAPSVFLDAIEASLDADDGVARLLEQEPAGGMDRAPHVAVLWALEILGWKPKLMARVAFALTRLATHDPGGTLANRPLASLRAMFSVVVPQTLADDSQRRRTLEGLVERHPAVGWDLLLELLEMVRGGALPRTRLPRFRGWDVPTTPTAPPKSTVWSRLREVLALALDQAGAESQRWSELVTRRFDILLPAPDADTIVTTLLSRKDAIDDPSASIWNALRARLSSTKRDDVMQRLRPAYDAFTPLDPITLALPLFRPPLTLPERYANWREKEARIDQAQQDFLRELASADDRERTLQTMLEALGPELRFMGQALAKSRLADDLEHRLLHERPAAPWDGLVPAFAARLRSRRAEPWLADTTRRLIAEGRHEDVTRILLTLWSEPQIWDLVDELGDPVRSNYWQRITNIGDHEDPPRYANALSRLLEVGNAGMALSLASYRVELLATEDLLCTLELVVKTPDLLDADDYDSDIPYHVDRIFDVLETRDNVDLARTAELESILSLRAGDTGRRSPYFVSQVLGQKPEEFARFVDLMYGSDDNGTELEDKNNKPHAHWAFHVLESWTYPGHDIEDPDERERVVFEWAERALTLTAADRRKDVGELEVAKVLARVPPAVDGHWPCIAARRLLETGQYPHLLRGLGNARFDQWGMRGRFIDEGQEASSLADQHSEAAVAVSTSWPRAAALLDDLARMFRDQAEHDRQYSYEDRINAGIRRSPEPSPTEPSPMEPHPPSTLTTLRGLQCTAVGPCPSLAIDLAPRLNLITGDNGLGKTFLLDTAWWVLTGAWFHDHPAMPHSWTEAAARSARIALRSDHEPLKAATFDPREERWSRPPTWPTTNALVFYIRVDGCFSVWDPEIATPRAPDTSAPMDLTPGEIWDGKRQHGTVLCNGLLTDWLQWQARHPAIFDRYFTVVRSLFEADVPVEPGGAQALSLRDAREIPTLRLPYAEIPVTLLSAGMKRVLAMAYVVTWAYERHQRARARRSLDPGTPSIVVLFDEVEAHLHPRWQRALLPALLRQLEALDGHPAVQVLATTHAPFVTASCEALFDTQTDGLFVFTQNADRIELRPTPWTTHGDITHWVTSPVFGLERGRSLEAERAIGAALAFMRRDPTGDPELTTHAQIHDRLRAVLSDTDEFWAHWIVSAPKGAAQ